MLCTIKLSGCDDNTIFELEVTEKEFLLLQRISDISNMKSTYDCMPIMIISKKES